jgi:hypothetical protein
MKTTRLLPLTFALSLASAAAPAAVLPVRLPGMIPLTPAPAISLPSLPAPVSGPTRLPGAPFVGPVSLPGASAPLPLPAPTLELPAPEIHLDWSFLDAPGDDGAAGAAVVAPRDRGPKPLPPSAAAAALKFAADGAKKDERLTRVGEGFFDLARPRVLVELP